MRYVFEHEESSCQNDVVVVDVAFVDVVVVAFVVGSPRSRRCRW